MVPDAPFSRIQIFVLMLVLGVVVVWLFRTTAAPARLSTWPGGSNSQAISGQAQPLTGRGEAANVDTPDGNPLGLPNTVMTQGYGVGTHAPAEVWGAIDLAIDGNGDGQADIDATTGTPIYATQSGTIKMTPNSYPAGNHLWVLGEHYKTGYSHLQGYAPGLQNGQQVKRGDLIGYVGSSGMSSGPHLDYQIWKDGVNVNPLDYGALNGTR